MTHTDTGRDELMMGEGSDLSPVGMHTMTYTQEQIDVSIIHQRCTRPGASVEEPAEDKNTTITTQAGEDQHGPDTDIVQLGQCTGTEKMVIGSDREDSLMEAVDTNLTPRNEEKKQDDPTLSHKRKKNETREKR
jgi:hypothetical protein